MMTKKGYTLSEGSVASRIKEARILLELSQGELAKHIGVVQSHLSDVERGKKTPTFRIVDSIIREFNVSAEWLFSGKGNPILSVDSHRDEEFTLAGMAQDVNMLKGRVSNLYNILSDSSDRTK